MPRPTRIQTVAAGLKRSLRRLADKPVVPTPSQYMPEVAALFSADRGTLRLARLSEKQTKGGRSGLVLFPILSFTHPESAV